jgi:hypothetical protein
VGGVQVVIKEAPDGFVIPAFSAHGASLLGSVGAQQVVEAEPAG